MLLSIIVPIYNTEQYLKRALLALQQLTFQDFECIMVDDGSTDESVAIARQSCHDDSRFHLIRNQHQGLYAALNTGLSHINGDYVTFYDSDDFLDANAFQYFEKKISQHPDLIISNLYFEKDGQPRRNSNYNFHDLQSSTAIRENFPLIYRQQMMYYNTNKIYRTGLLAQLKFQNLTVGLDTIFNYEVFARCETIDFNPQASYHYLQRGGSLVNHFDPQRLAIREIETMSLTHLLDQWHANYAKKLLDEEWGNTFANLVANLYAPLENGKYLSQTERLSYLETFVDHCKPNINFNHISPEHITLMQQAERCLQRRDDHVLAEKYSV